MIPPPLSHARKALSTGHKATISTEAKKDHAAQRGRGASEQRRASCASLSRRLSAFFESTSNQDPKAAKYAVLIPGPGMFVNVQYVSRVVIAAPSETPPSFGVCAVVCDLSRKAECVPTFACESKRGPFVREVETAMRNGWGTALVAATLPDLI